MIQTFFFVFPQFLWSCQFVCKSCDNFLIRKEGKDLEDRQLNLAGLFPQNLLLMQTTEKVMEAISEAEDRRDLFDTELQNSLSSEEPSIRRRAALALGRIQTPDCKPPLIKFLRDSTTEVRLEAIFALGQLGWNNFVSESERADISSAIYPFLEEEDKGFRGITLEAIGKLGAATSVSPIASMLSDSDSEVRSEALLAMYRLKLVAVLQNTSDPIPVLPTSVVPVLLKLAEDENVAVQRNLALLIESDKCTVGFEQMGGLCSSPDPWVRFQAIAAIGKSKKEPDRAVQLASMLLGDPTPAVRLAALKAFISVGQGGDPPAALADDPFHFVRAGFADALGASRDSQRAAPILTSLAESDPSASVRATALKALSRLRGADPQVRRLIDCFRTDAASFVARAAALEALAAILPEGERLEHLNSGLADPAVQVRVQAIELVAGVPGTEAFRVLCDRLASPLLAERAAAIAALRGRAEAAAEVQDPAWECYARSVPAGDGWVEVREEAAGCLADHLPPPDDPLCARAVERLLQVAGDPAPSVRDIARAALARAGLAPPPARPPPPATSSPYRAARYAANPRVRFDTGRGPFVVELFAADAPAHAANMAGFTEAGGYDGLLFHRVVPNYVVQGGDPDGSGYGSAGWLVRAEVGPARRLERGAVGMPRCAGFDTGGVQLFVALAPCARLDGRYTCFGRVEGDGMDVVDRLEVGDRILRARLVPA